MTLFYCNEPRSVGGLKRRMVIPVLSLDFREMVNFSTDHPDISVLTVPSRGKNDYRKRPLPMLKVDQDAIGVLEAEGAEEVSRQHQKVISWLIRRELYRDRHPMTEEIEEFFDVGIRGNMRELLKSGFWMTNPSSEVKNLQDVLEKIDLGRCNRLKSAPADLGSGVLVDRERLELKKQIERFGDKDEEYENGDAETRASLRRSSPWMAQKWINVFGE